MEKTKEEETEDRLQQMAKKVGKCKRCMLEKEMLLIALNRLCDIYLANRGTDAEFVSCITPNAVPEYWRQAEAAITLCGDK